MTGTKYILNGTELDKIESDQFLSYNFLIAELEDPAKRKSNFTKTIKFPGTVKNSALFTQISDLSKEIVGSEQTNFTIDFNPNKRSDIVVLQNEVQIFKGILQLLKVVIEDNNTIYECTLFGSVTNIVEEMSNNLLTDLDLSEYNHTWNKTNIVNSWDTEIVKDAAQLINFSGTPETGFVNGPPSGAGYTYPMIDYANNQTLLEFKVIDFYPAIYEKQYIDKIIEAAGFTYESSLYTANPDLLKVIIPYDGKQTSLSDTAATAREFFATKDTLDLRSGTLYFNGSKSAHFQDVFFSAIKFEDDSTGPNSDPSNIYNPLTGQYTVTQAGTYNIFGTTNTRTKLTAPAGTLSQIIHIDYYLSIYINGVEITRTITNERNWLSSAAPAFIEDSRSLSVQLNNYDLATGDVITIDQLTKITALYYSQNAFKTAITDAGSYEAEMEIASTFSNQAVRTTLLEGNELFINSFIPKKYTQKDFFKSFVNKYNLYIIPDDTKENHLIIEPIKDYYTGNETKDWSKKHDTGQVEIIPMSEVTAKTYEFTYKEDQDNWNQKYINRHIDIYGTKSVTVNNDFVKNTKKTELIFASTPGVGNFDNSMVIPRFVKVDEDTGVIQKMESILRCVYYGGLLSGGSWKLTSGLVADTIYSTYPYSGHLDHPETPAYDLNFEIPNEVYFGTPSGIGSNYTNNNLYNRFHRKYIEEITDKNSKLVIAWFRLTEDDIFNFQFSDFIFVQGLQGQIFRVLKISDYDSDNPDLTKVELLKVKTKDAFVPSTTQVGLTSMSTPGNFTIIEGGLNEIRNPFATNPELILEGGIDEVRNAFDTVGVLKVEGGNG